MLLLLLACGPYFEEVLTLSKTTLSLGRKALSKLPCVGMSVSITALGLNSWSFACPVSS